MFTTYAIVNGNGKIYIGYSLDLEKRAERHNGVLKNKSKSFTSKNKGFWRVFYKEEFETRSEAILREKQLKSCKGREFLRGILKNQFMGR